MYQQFKFRKKYVLRTLRVKCQGDIYYQTIHTIAKIHKLCCFIFFIKICCKAQSFAGKQTNIHNNNLYRSVIIFWAHIEMSAKQLNVSLGFKNA